ncbi:MAG: zf-HC2 domain-containing protein [Actinomycetota bacterium]
MGEQVQHPTDRLLAAFLDGRLNGESRTWIATHLDECEMCRARTIDTGGALSSSDYAGVEPEWGSARGEILQVFDAQEVPDLECGQLWRLEWEDIAALGVLLRVRDEDVTLIPAGEDPHMADEYTLILEEDQSPLGISLALWVDLETVVPLFVLDRWMGVVDLLAEVEEVRTAFQNGGRPASVNTGRPILHPLDERLQYREALAVRFTRLADAGLLLEVGEPGKAPSLLEIMNNAGAIPSEVAGRLGISAADMYSLLRGQRSPTTEEAAGLSEVVGVAPDILLRAGGDLDQGLVRILSHPKWRPAIRQRARERRSTEIAERMRVGYEVMAHAARRAGVRDAPLDWDRLARDYFGG